MHGVTMASQRANADVVFFERCNKFVVFCLVCKQLCRVAMRLAGITARAKFHRVHAKAGDNSQRLVQRLVSVQICKYTDFHKFLPRLYFKN